MDDDNVYRKMQGHWIIEMSEMIATANAKSIEEIKSFLSRQKETYKIPYETHPADRLRQCVFLLYGTPEEKEALVAEQRKEVMKLEQRFAEHRGGSPKQFGTEPER